MAVRPVASASDHQRKGNASTIRERKGPSSPGGASETQESKSLLQPVMLTSLYRQLDVTELGSSLIKAGPKRVETTPHYKKGI